MRSTKFFLIAVLMLAGTASADEPDPGTVYINSINFAGSGCPAGSVAGNISEDAHAFTLLFDSYTAEMGPGLTLSESRKNCQLALNIHVPQGWSYTLFTVDTRGFLNLETATRAVQQNKYYFQGSLAGPVQRTVIPGPYLGDYMTRDRIGIAALVWSRCRVNRALNVATQVYVAGQYGRRALATVDSIDGEFKLIYGIHWRRCV